MLKGKKKKINVFFLLIIYFHFFVASYKQPHKCYSEIINTKSMKEEHFVQVRYVEGALGT